MSREPSVKECIEQMKTELKVYGFGLAKYIVMETGLPDDGTIECPMCGDKLRYSIAARTNNHMSAKCARDGCLSMVE